MAWLEFLSDHILSPTRQEVWAAISEWRIGEKEAKDSSTVGVWKAAPGGRRTCEGGL